MDDFLMIRFALDNVHPSSLGEGARAAFDRVLNGEAIGDADSRDGKSYARLRGNRRLHGVSNARVTSQRPPRLQRASVQQDGSLNRAPLFLKQKEAAASI
jgi:hypothetical protein